LEVPVHVTLVGKAGGVGRVCDRLAGFEETAGGSQTMGDLKGVGR
jgi:hypothetical protein